jgi:hypothetical protein
MEGRPMQSDSIITRAEAMALGLTRYFTGKPCCRGHIDQRSTKSASCFECVNVNQPNHDKQKKLAGKRRFYRNHKDKILADQKKRYQEKREDISAQHREYYEANRETIKEKSRKWASENKERKARIDREYRAANPESVKKNQAVYVQRHHAKIKQRTRAWYRENRDHVLDLARKCREANPEKYGAYARTSKARRKAAPGKHTGQDVRDIWERQKERCAVPRCTHPISNKRCDPNIFHVDHIVALANGGTNWKDNVQILCGFHNMQKQAMDDMEWAQRELGMLFVP